MKITTFCIAGSGSSSSDDRPLTNAVRRAMSGLTYASADGTLEIDFFSYTPFRFRKKCAEMNEIAVKRGIGLYLFAAKSFGAYQLYKHHCELAPILNCRNNHVAIVTVDPHAPFWKCGPGNPIKAWWLVHRLYAKHVRAWSVYQRERYPRGAVVFGAENIRVTKTTHRRIVTSLVAETTYREAALWLMKEGW